MRAGVVVVGMVAVAVCFGALALTDSKQVRESQPALRTVVVAAWMLVVVAGWGFVACVAFVAPGGLDGAWHWVRSQSVLLQVAMWALLLPWMAAVWISQTSWPEWLRWGLVAVLGVASILLSFSGSRRSQRS